MNDIAINFGMEEGLGKRLAYWSNQLRCNRAYPWVGTGLIADLECAATLLGAELLNKVPEPEYDL